MVTSAFTEKKANIKSFAFPFFVCVPLLHHHLMHQSSEKCHSLEILQCPFYSSLSFPGKGKEGGGGERKKHKTGSRRSFRSNSWRPEVMEETRTSPPLLLLPIDVCNSRRIRSPPRCTHTHGPMFPLSLLSTLVCQCFVECTRKRERERKGKSNRSLFFFVSSLFVKRMNQVKYLGFPSFLISFFHSLHCHQPPIP